MSKVLITRSKLDGLATTISAKSGEPLPLTIAQMDAAVQGISSVDVEALNVTSNGTYTAPSGTAYSPVTVNVAMPAPSLQSKSVTPSTSQQTVQPDSGYDGLSSVTVGAIPSQYIVPTGTKSITANATGIDVAQYASVDVAVPSSVPSLQSKSVSYTPSETTQSATVTADSGYDGLSSVAVSVGAISSTYVGSGITRRSSTDLTASGATVTVPAGYYSAQASKAIGAGSVTAPTITVDSETGEISASTRINAAGYLALNTTRSSTRQLDTQAATTITPSTSAQTAVEAGKYTTGAVTVAAMPSGTAGTPTATKGTVSNHSVSVTPSVTNTAGYIAGGTKSGTAVSVSASELVSGTYTVSASGTHDVTNYKSASVASGGATASATKGAVSNHSVTVTPSVTRTAGYVTAGTADGAAVTVSASELVSGSQTITDNGTVDVTNLASVTVDIDFVTYHTSSSEPTSSQGSDGDIWLVTE